MAITKLTVGSKGDVNNSNGADLKVLTDAVIDIVEDGASGNTALKTSVDSKASQTSFDTLNNTVTDATTGLAATKVIADAAKTTADANKLIVEDATSGNAALKAAIDSIVGGANSINERFKSAIASQTNYTYIITGDSTRDSVSTPAIPYYTEQLAKLNFDIYNNAFSGQSAGDWKDNIGGSTLQQAMDNTSGTGSTTILEYSFGINRQGGATPAQAKQNIIDGINAYLTAKPDAIILFVSPVFSTNNSMESIYDELKVVFPEQFFVSGLKATQDVHGNSDYYADQTHPNINGAKRLVNYILSEITPLEVKPLVTMYNTPPLGSIDVDLPAVVESGYYNVSDGVPTANAAWRRLAPIAVEPNFALLIDHGGNKYNVVFMDELGVYVSDGVSQDVAGEVYKRIVVPSGAYEARVIISSEGATWDALGYTPTVRYELSSVPYMRQQFVNIGLQITLPIVEQSLFIDSNGLTGSAGQVLTAQGGGVALWQ